ncbi:RdgB/HAM1 family non-canonical purine NTP pyrophosphatase [Candidatus Gottesmanbacteria bacterium]|nr:RdgB/HAM1 family non-canonical purine NTP pyrophosphatase [Candidatus Gottesmanbacteria bacterium]
MKILLLATRNKGKIREIKNILKDISYEIKTLSDIGIKDDIAETGKTYKENAILKAKSIGEKSGLLTLGEDSGLEIDTLAGWPGIKSARHTEGSDQDRIDVIIKKIKKIPPNKRSAKYVAVVAAYDKTTKKVSLFRGEAKGKILDHMEGLNGFGYDPIFWSNDLEKTFGEASEKEKDKISHRARALKLCKIYLRKKLE